MTRKIVWVLVAAVLGAVLGGVLGYGPLLRYKAGGVFGMEMGLAEYQQFTERADAPATLQQLARVMPLPALTAKEMGQLETEVSQGQWHTPIPKVNKADASSVPDALLQLNLNNKSNKDNLDDSVDRRRERERALRVFLGVRLTYVAHNAARAAQLATWLGRYFREVAAHEALRSQVRRWAADGREFADSAPVQRLQYAFDIEQAQARAKALKGIVASYPEAARHDSPQVVDVTKGSERFMSPMAQLVGAESEVINIQEKLQKLDRDSDQQAFAKPLIAEAETVLAKAPGGSDSVARVSEAIAKFAGMAKTDAEKEMLASMAADVSQISGRFLSQAQFIAVPAVPSLPERPSPRMVIVLSAVLAALLAAAIAWRGFLIKLLWEDDRDQEKEKAA